MSAGKFSAEINVLGTRPAPSSVKAALMHLFFGTFLSAALLPHPSPLNAQTNSLRTLNQAPANTLLPNARQELDRTQTRQEQDFSTRQQLENTQQRRDVDRLNENVMRNNDTDCPSSQSGCER